MKIHTTRFGEIDAPDDSLIRIPDGVLGFPDSRKFVLLEHDSHGTPFKWLQAADEPNLAFIVMDPNLVVENYAVEFDEETAKLVGAKGIDPERFAMMSIVNIPHDNPIAMTVNIRAPIVVRLEDRTGWQVILPDESYPIRHRLFPDPAEGESEGR